MRTPELRGRAKIPRTDEGRWIRCIKLRLLDSRPCHTHLPEPKLAEIRGLVARENFAEFGQKLLRKHEVSADWGAGGEIEWAVMGVCRGWRQEENTLMPCLVFVFGVDETNIFSSIERIHKIVVANMGKKYRKISRTNILSGGYWMSHLF